MTGEGCENENPPPRSGGDTIIYIYIYIHIYMFFVYIYLVILMLIYVSIPSIIEQEEGASLNHGCTCLGTIILCTTEQKQQ